MRVSRKAEYACIAVLELAINHDQPQPIRVRAIADAHGIPQRFLVQILLQLKTSGLVASTRGAAGGYQLARNPELISLADVIQAIDKDAHKPLPAASRSPAGQAIHSAWKDIQTEEQRLLKQVTFAELVRRSQHSSELSYQI